MKATLVSNLVAQHKPYECYVPGPVQFRLVEPLEVTIDGVLYRAPIGATTDGASTPRALRSLVPRVGRHIYGAIIHDAAYRGVLQKYTEKPFGPEHNGATITAWELAKPTREWADNAFLACMVAADTGWLTRKMAFWAVRLFGRWSYKGWAPR